MPFFQTKTLSHYYEVVGQGDPLLLIAGLGGDTTIWTLLVSMLADKFKLIMLDNRAAGRTPIGIEPLSTELMAQDCIALLDHLNIKTSHIIGNSMGGAIAQQIAIHHSDRVNKLILYSSFSLLEKRERMSLETNAELLNYDIPRELWILNLLKPCFSNTFLSKQENIDLIIEADRNNLRQQTKEMFDAQLAACIKHNTTNLLTKIAATTLIIAGSDDQVTPLFYNEFLFKHIKKATMKVIDGVGHLADLEKPYEFNKIILDFLA